MRSRAKILVIDNDRDVGELVYAILNDSGYSVSLLFDLDRDAIRAAVGRVEPDCVLLDGENSIYGRSWETAALLHERSRSIPVVMFSTSRNDLKEGEAAVTDRSKAAEFVAFVNKPFEVEELLHAVETAVGESVPFNHSVEADSARSEALVERLRAEGARDVRRSTRREWVTFQHGNGLMQLYWWQRGGCYYVGRYPRNGAVMINVGRFYDLESAIECGLRLGSSKPDQREKASTDQTPGSQPPRADDGIPAR
jgi:CheY-like chemotaxis protein